MTKLTLSVFMFLLALLLSLNMSAASVAAPAEPVDACPLWRTAGAQKIFKCVDEDAYVTCWVQELGIMQCVPYQ